MSAPSISPVERAEELAALQTTLTTCALLLRTKRGALERELAARQGLGPVGLTPTLLAARAFLEACDGGADLPEGAPV